ncbi:MAG: hypothetical protein A3G93_16660 [Nitrospinae bacterium RIFCSPLOWO2_12_FULL_45_22]|nr:MAG: hypothetical protein A3G93_16660 [Nitrospinae bacterium RIFCSPLOWO2_12_FULL_45_22]
MNKKKFFPFILLLALLLPGLFLLNCSKKGKLLKFSAQYQLYPQHWQKYRLFIEEGEPDYVVYASDRYQERWVYICLNKIYNFQELPGDKKNDEEEQRFKIASEALKGSELEKKLSAKDRERLKNCIEKKKGQEQP